MTKSLSTAVDKAPEDSKLATAAANNLSQQLRMAGQVQRDFLPRQLPDCEFVRWAATFFPAEWVSGDIYDVVRIDEQHIGFYVADVVGHGMPAALLTIFVKQALVMRETAGNTYRIFSPSEVMMNLNLRLTEQQLSGNQFVTCCYCLLDIETLQVTYSRAGHPYPVVLRANEQPRQLEIQGSLLGIFEHIEYPQQTVQLQAGDKLLVYSDGAEPFIGHFDEQQGFDFSEVFCEIKDLPVVEMIKKFNGLVEVQPKSSEADDITAVSLEVL